MQKNQEHAMRGYTMLLHTKTYTRPLNFPANTRNNKMYFKIFFMKRPCY